MNRGPATLLTLVDRSELQDTSSIIRLVFAASKRQLRKLSSLGVGRTKAGSARVRGETQLHPLRNILVIHITTTTCDVNTASDRRIDLDQRAAPGMEPLARQAAAAWCCRLPTNMANQTELNGIGSK